MRCHDLCCGGLNALCPGNGEELMGSVGSAASDMEEA